MDQQDLIDRIVSLAINISLSRHRFIDVEFEGIANQIRVEIIFPSGKIDHSYAIDLHEPEEADVAKKRVNRLLLEVATYLESLHSKISLQTQRSFSL